MRITETSQPLDCASARQTPAICRPISGLTSGRPGTECATEMAAPQLEQKRALVGNPVPQRLQKKGILENSSRWKGNRSLDTNGIRARFLGICSATQIFSVRPFNYRDTQNADISAPYRHA